MNPLRSSSETSEIPTQFSDEGWAEVEKLLNEFSDEEWAELERLLGITTAEETPQRDEGAPLNPKRQQQIEKVVEETPVDPSGRQEVQHQRRLPLKTIPTRCPRRQIGTWGNSRVALLCSVVRVGFPHLTDWET